MKRNYFLLVLVLSLPCVWAACEKDKVALTSPFYVSPPTASYFKQIAQSPIKDPNYENLRNFQTDNVPKGIDQILRAQFPVELGRAAKTLSIERQALPGSTKFRLAYKTDQGISYWITTLEKPTQITPLQGNNPTVKPTVGGFKPLENFANDPDFKIVDAWVRAQYPGLLKWARVASVDVQIVSGMIYNILYKASEMTSFRISAYSQPWTQTLKILSYEVIQLKNPAN